MDHTPPICYNGTNDEDKVLRSLIPWDSIKCIGGCSRPEPNEEEVGNATTAEECYHMVKEHLSEKQKTKPNGMTWVGGSEKERRCFAKYEVTHITDGCTVNCSSCIFDGKYYKQYCMGFRGKSIYARSFRK